MNCHDCGQLRDENLGELAKNPCCAIKGPLPQCITCIDWVEKEAYEWGRAALKALRAGKFPSTVCLIVAALESEENERELKKAWREGFAAGRKDIEQ